VTIIFSSSYGVIKTIRIWKNNDKTTAWAQRLIMEAEGITGVNPPYNDPMP